MAPPLGKAKSRLAPGEAADSAVFHERIGGVDWCAQAAWRMLLADPAAPNWFALGDSPRAEFVKQGRGRMVWRVPLGDRTVYAKVFDGGRLTDRLKQWLRGSPARREWNVVQRASAKSVDVVHAVGFGVCADHRRQSVFLSEAATGATDLRTAWSCNVQKNRSLRGRHFGACALIAAVARLLAESHERGFCHLDCHPHNMLVWAGTEGEWRALFADVHPSRCYNRAVPMRAAVRSLAQLDQSFHRLASRTQRLRLLLAYLNHRQGDGGRVDRRLLRDWVQNIHRARAGHAQRLARQRDRRLRRRGRYFTTLSIEGGWTAVVTLRLERRHLFPEPDVPDRTKTQWQRILPLLLASHTRAEDRVVSEREESERAEGLRLQTDVPSGLGQRLAWWVTKPRQWKVFIHGHHLRHRDQSAELILGYAQRRRWGLVAQTALIHASPSWSERTVQAGEKEGEDHDEIKDRGGSR